jgi:hypothetical protein
MSDLTINSNLASSGKVNHKSIGSNGSFWLPPKMQSMSFDSSLKQLSSSSKTSLAPSGEQAKVSTPGSFNPVKSDLTNRNLSMLRDANFFENRPLQTPGKPLIPSSSPLRSSVKDTGSASSSIIHSMPSAVNSSSVMISSSEAIPQLAPLSHLTIGKSGNSEYVLFSSSASNSGTKNANFSGSEFNKDAFFSTQSDFPSTSLTENQVIEFIKSYQTGSLSFGASKKGVVRFAFSLEDGSSVSVRLEQKRECLQICFISETASALKSLQSKFASISEDRTSCSDQTFMPLFFSSYSEMDACLLNSQ